MRYIVAPGLSATSRWLAKGAIVFVSVENVVHCVSVVVEEGNKQ
jgi:hypothetical protein